MFFFTLKALYIKKFVLSPLNKMVLWKENANTYVAWELKFQASRPFEYWNDCTLTATYLINRIPSPLLLNKTSYELLFNSKPTYVHIRVFGSLCFATKLSHSRKKFDSKIACIFFLDIPLLSRDTNFLILTQKKTCLSVCCLSWVNISISFIFIHIHHISHP